MNSHKERLRTIAGKNSSLAKHNNRSSSLNQSRRSTSRLTDNVAKVSRSKSGNTYTGEDSDSNDRRSPLYINVQKSQKQNNGSESPYNFDNEDGKRHTKSMDRLQHDYQSRHTLTKPNGTLPYIPRDGRNIYKSRSLNALRATEPSTVLNKSSIQQEYHDKAVQLYFRGLTYGKARRPCRIATAMFVLFVLFFIAGLVIIGLTYLYQNIMPTLDIGVAIGPSILASSFIFLGVGVKFLYDAHKISRRERRRIGYTAYDHRYVGVKSNVYNPIKANEKLVSGSSTNNALTRIPKSQVNNPTYEDPTLMRSSQVKMSTRDTKTEKSSNV